MLVVGALKCVTISRPEICFSVNKICQFMSVPLESHWVAVKRILRHLKSTLQCGLQHAPDDPHQPFSIRTFCDACLLYTSRANPYPFEPSVMLIGKQNPIKRSTSEASICLGPDLVSWWSRKQTVVARSSIETENCSLGSATAGPSVDSDITYWASCSPSHSRGLLW